MFPFLKDEVRIVRVMNGVVAGTTVQTSSAIDMQQDGGYDELTVLAGFGALSANQVTYIKAQQSSDDAVADTYDDIAGSKSSQFADADSNKMLCMSLRPQKRYVKIIVNRGTGNAVIDGVWAILSRSKKRPTSQPSTVVGWGTLDYPAEGTA